jgi:hypothetical protein
MRVILSNLPLVEVSILKLDYPEDQLAGGPLHKPRTAHLPPAELKIELSFVQQLSFDLTRSEGT